MQTDHLLKQVAFIKEIDKLKYILRKTRLFHSDRHENDGGTWKEFNVPYQKVYAKKKAIKEGSTPIWEYAEKLLDESVNKGILKK